MDASPKGLDKLTVDEVLRRWPDTAVIFRQYGLACLGCAVAPFCEVTAVANIYNLPQEQFLADLRTAIEKTPV